jgi:hypothetical protein
MTLSAVSLDQLISPRTRTTPNWVNTDTLQRAHTRKSKFWIQAISAAACILLAALCVDKALTISELREHINTQPESEATVLSLSELKQLSAQLAKAEQERQNLIDFQNTNQALFEKLNTLQAWSESLPGYWIEKLSWHAQDQAPWTLQVTWNEDTQAYDLKSSLQKHFPQTTVEEQSLPAQKRVILSLKEQL